jgi:hypothetical protein
MTQEYKIKEAKSYITHQLLRLCDDADTGRFAREEITRMVKLIEANLINQ